MSPRCDAVCMNCKENQYPLNNVALQGVWIQRCAEFEIPMEWLLFDFRSPYQITIALPHQIHGIPSGWITIGRNHFEENGVHRCDD